ALMTGRYTLTCLCWAARPGRRAVFPHLAPWVEKRFGVITPRRRRACDVATDHFSTSRARPLLRHSHHFLISFSSIDCTALMYPILRNPLLLSAPVLARPPSRSAPPLGLLAESPLWATPNVAQRESTGRSASRSRAALASWARGLCASPLASSRSTLRA